MSIRTDPQENAPIRSFSWSQMVTLSTLMIPALIGASASLFVFLLGQWWLMRTAQTAFLRAKLEEFWIALEVISEACRFPTMDPDWDQYKIANVMMERAGELSGSMARAHMFAHLYFPEAVPRFDELAHSVSALNEWQHDYGDPETPYEIQTGISRMAAVVKAVTLLRGYLKDEQGYLTFRVRDRF